MEKTILLDEAYKKILASKDLQMKFVEAAKDNKLEAFLKEQNIEATLEEVKEYLTKKFVDNKDELSKEELDMAAGGDKETAGKVGYSILTWGFGCIFSKLESEQNPEHVCTL